MRNALLILFLSIQFIAYGQKVGLVLSGGAAKGLAHVGVLKALEENEIPVDYIVGTSIGGIIGGCYAAGMSPLQIEQMVLSDQFLRWINGLPETGYNYYYHRADETPQFLKLNLALDSTFNLQLNSSIANDVSLNFAIAEKMAQASVICNNNFDSLFVPLRVVTADIFTQREEVLSKGSLSDALRATQTVPFFYNPIRVDGKYLFDGGVYNNFPVDVIQRDFKPDVVIGVNVSSKVFDEYPFDSDEKLISHSLLYLLLDKSDPSRIPDSGVYIQPDLKGFTSFDFGRVKSLIDSGYIQTIRQIDEIKQKIGRRESCDAVAGRRNTFNDRNVPYAFGPLTFQHFNSKQRGYIRAIFHSKLAKENFTYSQIKSGFFKLVSEEYFSNVYPNILYERDKHQFSLKLTRRPQQNFQVGFGGVIATRDVSNVFLGLNFYNFDRILTHASVGFQTGNFYKSALMKVRVDFPYQFYVEPYLSFDGWNYLNNEDLLNEVSTPATPTILKRLSRRYGLNLGLPIKNSFKGIVVFEGFNTTDRYINGDVFISTDKLDELKLKGFKTGLHFSSNNLNRRQYANAGRMFGLTLDYFSAKEEFFPGSTSVTTQPVTMRHDWLRVRATAEQYFGFGWYRPGYLAEAVVSNQPYFQNYFGTIINAPAFMPLQDSRTLMLQNFRAMDYAAIGLKNIFTIRNHFEFRLEGYIFKPLYGIVENVEQRAVENTDKHSIFFAGTAGFVYHSAIGPVSLSTNYYDDDENKFGVLLHVGFLLFNKHSFE
ncbi:MAG TPA: patatin-like phospholipase family protein [Chryseolinea sp.]|nr:patatin-like phospholipase family protein [Chryseolinea sp.]